MNFNTTHNYTISYKQNGQWLDLKGWSRPFYRQDKLDETLNNGNITLNVKELQMLPPFTKVRIRTECVDGATKKIVKEYFVTSNEPIMQRTFVV